MKNFNLNFRVVAFSDDGSRCVIRADDYPEGIARAATRRFKLDVAEEEIRRGLVKAFPLIHPKGKSISDRCKIQGSDDICCTVVDTEQLKKARPEYFEGLRPTNKELLEEYTRSQRSDSHFKWPEYLEFAQGLWVGTVAARVDFKREHKLGNELIVHCEPGW